MEKKTFDVKIKEYLELSDERLKELMDLVSKISQMINDDIDGAGSIFETYKKIDRLLGEDKLNARFVTFVMGVNKTLLVRFLQKGFGEENANIMIVQALGAFVDKGEENVPE